MSPVLLKTAVRAWFLLMSRDRASRKIQELCDRYLALAERIDAGSGSRAVRVPKMPGIDEEMRDWSFFMILEHNVIVNRSIMSIVAALARGEEPTGAGAIDMKRDVMPSENAGVEQIDALRDSVAEHLRVVSGLRRLGGGLKKRHPVFGQFNAHQWHCMFAFHLLIHYRQALYVVRAVSA